MWAPETWDRSRKKLESSDAIADDSYSTLGGAPLNFPCFVNRSTSLRWPSAAAKAKGRISLVAKTEWPETKFQVFESSEDLKTLEAYWKHCETGKWLIDLDTLTRHHARFQGDET